ncbi:hypothetical protein [Agrococcus casei]|uniref:hypothetical protein n=1 Tax=Agrococcus casei TaxID=343512 RepID=UPI003F8E67F7
MDFTHIVPIATTAVTVLGTVAAAIVGNERGPKDLRRIRQLAEAVGHLPEHSDAAKALHEAIGLIAGDYTDRLKEVRGRKLNSGVVSAILIVGVAAIASVYGLSTLATWLGSLGGWAIAVAVVIWIVLALAVLLAILLIAAGWRTLYAPRESMKRKG